MQNTYFGLQDATLSPEALAAHAREVAQQRVGKTARVDFPRLSADVHRITESFVSLSRAAETDERIAAGDWLMDNYHLIEQTIKGIEAGFAANLPRLREGSFAGLPRVYRIAVEICGHREGQVDAASIASFLDAFQSEISLSMAEIGALKDMLLVALIKLVTLESADVLDMLRQRDRADTFFKKLREVHAFSATAMLKREKLDNAEFVTRLLQRLREEDAPAAQVLEAVLLKRGTSGEQMMQSAQRQQVRGRLLMGNAITSIRTVSQLDWAGLFCKVSRVESALLEDPVYASMDAASRAYYRRCVVRLARRAKVSEAAVAISAAELAAREPTDVSAAEAAKRRHNGYYLCAEGQAELFERLGTRPPMLQAGWAFFTCLVAGSTFAIALLYGASADSLPSVLLAAFLPSLICAFSYVQIVCQKFFAKLPQRQLPRLELDPDTGRDRHTAIVVPALVDSPERAAELMKKLEVHYLATRDPNVCFVLLADLPEADAPDAPDDHAVRASAAAEAARLNEKYGWRFFALFRERRMNADGRWTGRERKRGALEDFNRYLLTGDASAFAGDPEENAALVERFRVRFVLTLDADTVLPIGAAQKLIGTMLHPLNRPEIDAYGRIVRGHGLIAPRIELTARSAAQTPFSRVFAMPYGVDAYAGAVSESYQDLFDEGNYAGKGIYDVALFAAMTEGLPENTILSHDLFEGSLLRAGLSSDTALYDGFPPTYEAYSKRNHRWLRGDWQNLAVLSNPRLTGLHRFRMIDNLRRGLVKTSALLLLLLAPVLVHGWVWGAVAWLALFGDLLWDFFASLLRAQDLQLKISDALDDIRNAALRAAISMAVLPYEAYLEIDAAVRALYRSAVSHKRMLEWTTSAQLDRAKTDTLTAAYRRMWVGVAIAAATMAESVLWESVPLGLIAIFWAAGPYLAALYSRRRANEALSQDDADLVRQTAERAWAFFADTATAEHNYLPPDNLQIEPRKAPAPRTSPTNIGMLLAGAYAAQSLGLITAEAMLDQCEKTLDTVERLEKWKGQLYNWYDTKNLAPLRPRFVSSVDGGNFAVSLMTLREGARKACSGYDFILRDRAAALCERIDALLLCMDFSTLYDAEKHLFFIGWDEENRRMNGAHYDLMASEARLLSFIAIAKGDVEVTHWFHPSRALTTIEGKRLLISWSGTMFEYLMPALFLRSTPDTLIDESEASCVSAQKRYADKNAQNPLPWGVSESGFYEFDLAMQYQYKAFGIPGAGVKTSRTEAVIAPYATMLALMVDPLAACKNLHRLKAIHAWGYYGFYEAIDATSDRVKPPFAIVKSFMAHHLGMSLLAAANALGDNAIVEALHEAAEVQAAEILLEERPPSRSIVIRAYNSALPDFPAQPYKEIDAQTRAPKGAALQATVMGDALEIIACSNGVTRAVWEGIALYRSRLDRSRPQAGCALFVREAATGLCWNAADGDATFEAGKAVWSCTHEGLKSTLEICSPDEAAELRVIEIQNDRDVAVELDVYAYTEVCLNELADDESHKAFHKLFVENRDAADGLLSFRKRPRHHENPVVLAAQWTDPSARLGSVRSEAIGRLRTLEDAAFLSDEGFVLQETPLDPCALFGSYVRLEPGEVVRFGLALCIARDDTAIEAARAYRSWSAFERGFSIAWTSAQVQIRHLGLSGQLKPLRLAMAQLLLPGARTERQCELARLCTQGIEGLWGFGLSGDLPIVCVEIADEKQIKGLRDWMLLLRYLRLHGTLFDLVILNAEAPGYAQPVQEGVAAMARSFGLPLRQNGGVFLLHEGEAAERAELIRATATLLVEAGRPMSELFAATPPRSHPAHLSPSAGELALELPKLEHWNGWGGFDELEYVIRVSPDRPTPLPWCNVLANERFGALITESGGGYTWAVNSRENKLSPWENDPVTDRCGEVCFLRDEESQRTWSVLPQPKPAGSAVVRHGLGYTSVVNGGESLYQSFTVFVDAERPAKIMRVRVKNPLQRVRKLSLYYGVEWVLGVAPGKTRIASHCEDNILIATKGGKGLAYLAAPGRVIEWTGSRESFFANDFEGLRAPTLDGKPGAGSDAASVLRLPFVVGPGEEAEIVLVMGYENGGSNTVEENPFWQENAMQALRDICTYYAKKDSFERELSKVKALWKRRTETLTVASDDRAFDKMMNGRLLYQVWSSRLLGRTGYYQCGGAFGFRDQLQDVQALLLSAPERARQQLLLCAAHQFEDGDVQHWWHPPAMGVRTEISDDLLFLPYIAMRYWEVTADDSVWRETVPYLRNVDIPEGAHDIYVAAQPSEQEGSLFDHCLRAIDRVAMGERGLPKIGGGDWNDGMDEVRGESVWLAWFFYSVLMDMRAVCRHMGDDMRATALEARAIELQKNIQKHAWDGEWYRRAFFADGTPLGSRDNTECRIDSISQSWAVISGAADEKRGRMAMRSLEKHLVDRQSGIVKLLTPPFDVQEPRAGYIQGYVPGTRENGGQYTHAAIWAVLGFLRMGDHAKAAELFSAINPIRHGDNPIIAGLYQGEPYVLAADVYAHPEHLGRAGWTWYTGAAAWLYVVGWELLGVKKRGTTLELDAAAAEFLGAYNVDYRFASSLYRIRFEKGGGKKVIDLIDDGACHEICMTGQCDPIA